MRVATKCGVAAGEARGSLQMMQSVIPSQEMMMGGVKPEVQRLTEYC
jgi:hypothetical protein